MFLKRSQNCIAWENQIFSNTQSKLMPCPSIHPNQFWKVQIGLDQSKLFWTCPNCFDQTKNVFALLNVASKTFWISQKKIGPSGSLLAKGSTVLKGGFYSEREVSFSNLPKKYSKSLSWAWNLKKLFTVIGGKFKFQV